MLDSVALTRAASETTMVQTSVSFVAPANQRSLIPFILSKVLISNNQIFGAPKALLRRAGETRLHLRFIPRIRLILN